MALTILAKISPSNNSPFFSLGTEVRGTNTKSYHFPVSFFFFLPSGPPPCHKNAPCLTVNGQRPSFQSPLSPSHTFFFPLRFDLGFLFLHTLAWQLLCQLLPPPPHSQAWATGGPRSTSRSVCSSRSDRWSVKEPRLPRVTVFRQPTGRRKTPSQKVCLSLFKSLSS